VKISADALEAVKETFAADKTTGATPEWLPHKHRADCLSCVATLWVGEVSRFGLQLDIHGPKLVRPDRPFYGLTAMMFAHVSGERLHLVRLEFDPTDSLQIHRNPMNTMGAPPEVRGPHYHPFEHNVALGAGALGLLHDLPIAFPFSNQFDTFHDVQEALRVHMRIPGLWLEEPPCSTTIV
jgi:hypothetical protein